MRKHCSQEAIWCVCARRNCLNVRGGKESQNPGVVVERFQIPATKIHLVSQVISATLEVGLIKPDEKVGTSKKLARYLPHWA